MTQAALFADLPEDAAPILPTRIPEMYRLYGATPGAKCKTCNHLLIKRLSGTYYKCDLTHITAGPGSDWRTGYDACGKWEPEEH